jgi:hypothetical protein
MTKEERQFLLSALRAVESLHFRNVALESILEKFPPDKLPDWNDTARKLSADPALQPQIRERFHRIFAELEASVHPSQSALADLLLSLPMKGKPN